MNLLTFLVDYCYDSPEERSLSGRWSFNLPFSNAELDELCEVYANSEDEYFDVGTAVFTGHDELAIKINNAALDALTKAMVAQGLPKPDALDVLWELKESFYYDEEAGRWILERED